MKDDWLVTASLWFVQIMRLILCFIALGLGVGILFAIFGSAEQFATLDTELMEADLNITGRISLGMVFTLALAALVLGERFLFQLKLIIDTVPGGEPFVIDNAHRLERMGWIVLAIQALGLATAFFAATVAEMASKLSIKVEFSLTGLFLAAILFILARVFRHGATMREDLEGTV